MPMVDLCNYVCHLQHPYIDIKIISVHIHIHIHIHIHMHTTCITVIVKLMGAAGGLTDRYLLTTSEPVVGISTLERELLNSARYRPFILNRVGCCPFILNRAGCCLFTPYRTGCCPLSPNRARYRPFTTNRGDVER